MKTYTVEDIKRSLLDFKLNKNLSVSGLSELIGITRRTRYCIMDGKLSYIRPATIRKLKKANVID